MTKAYQYDSVGYYAGEIEDYGLLPNNATRMAPQERNGFVPRWTGGAWEQVENHKGKEGYKDGQAHTIKEYGPLPEGWSATPPPPTRDELADSLRSARNARIAATDRYMLPDAPVSDSQRAAWAAYRNALRELTRTEGFPWDGGGEATPWPASPE